MPNQANLPRAQSVIAVTEDGEELDPPKPKVFLNQVPAAKITHYIDLTEEEEEPFDDLPEFFPTSSSSSIIDITNIERRRKKIDVVVLDEDSDGSSVVEIDVDRSQSTQNDQLAGDDVTNNIGNDQASARSRSQNQNNQVEVVVLEEEDTEDVIEIDNTPPRVPTPSDAPMEEPAESPVPPTRRRSQRTQNAQLVLEGSSNQVENDQKVATVPVRRRSRSQKKQVVVQEEKKKNEKSKEKLEIDNLPPRIPIGLSHTPYTHKPPQKLPDDNSEQEPIPKNTRGKKNLSNDEALKVGPKFQATLPPRMSKEEYRAKVAMEEEDEEIMWKPPKTPIPQKTMQLYWRAVYRQFEGQIPVEYAYLNLMKNNYSIPDALENIDEMLKRVPQKFKPLGDDQYQKFVQILREAEERKRQDRRNRGNPKPKTDDEHNLRGKIHRTAMKNYHPAEVNKYYHQWRAVHKAYRNKTCRCNDALIADLSFVPRWACANCHKSWKKTTPSRNLCLICQTYREVTGKMRPALNVVFNDEERDRIEYWVELERKEKKRVSSMRFERSYEERWKRRIEDLKLTKEEEQQLDLEKLPFKEDHFVRRGELSDFGKDDVAAEYLKQLKPHPIQLFVPCRCEKALGLVVEEEGIHVTVTKEVALKMKKKVLANAGIYKKLAKKVEDSKAKKRKVQ